MSVRDDKQQDLDRDRVGHEGHELTTDQVLRTAPLPGVEFSSNGLCEDAGVVTLAGSDATGTATFTDAFLIAVAAHRHFDRELAAVPA